MPRRPAAIPLTEANYEALREIDKEQGSWSHTVTWGLDYKTARGQAGAAEDDTGEAYSVFTYRGRYGVSPTKWITKSWLKRASTKLKEAKPKRRGLLSRLFRISNPACGGTKPVELISDRAKRYRANHPDCRPAGLKICAFCGSKKNVEVHHIDGNEDHGATANLAWCCRSCNTAIGVAHKRAGVGQRTRQFNAAPDGRIPSYAQYARAVSIHVRGEHDEGGAVIHATPPSVRADYARRIASEKRKRGTDRRSEVPF